MASNKKALVAPLNWGLGHATRCIPIIRTLLQQNVEVHLASDGQAYALLIDEFPNLRSFQLPKLEIFYHEHFMWSMARQTTKFLKSIQEDTKATASLMLKFKFDYIFSDNRYGVFHKNATNILITHQLQVVKPLIFSASSRFLLNRFSRKFDHCWIPDKEGIDNLTGRMSSSKLDIPKTYIGILSRFEKLRANKDFEIAIILSGPEPARTKFENTILELYKEEIGAFKKTALVRGVLGHSKIDSPNPNLEIFNFLNAKQLNKLIQSTPKIVCRSGYSSIMDLVKLNKKALLVPTPGQVEQEYLAERLDQKEMFVCIKQDDFSLDLLDLMDDLSVENNSSYSLSLTRIIEQLLNSF